MNKITRGGMGEIAAARYLRDKGYDIAASNYSCRQGEIDIIARNKEYIVFVEVKTRSAGSIARGRDSVNKQKQSKIITTAMLYLAETGLELQPRFDIIEIVLKNTGSFEIAEIIHLENAFGAEGENAYI